MKNTPEKSKILLVDDDHVFLHVYTTILQQHFATDGAQSPEEALEMLADKGPYAVVVTDLNMPELNGLDFLRQVTRIAPRTKRILFTGKPDLDSVLAAINQARVFGYLSKEAQPEELVAKVREALREYQREEPASSRGQVLTDEERDFFARSANDD